MFSPQDLDLISAICNDEVWLLQHIETKGIQTAKFQSDVMTLRAKCIEASANMKKSEAAKAAEMDKKGTS